MERFEFKLFVGNKKQKMKLQAISRNSFHFFIYLAKLDFSTFLNNTIIWLI